MVHQWKRLIADKTAGQNSADTTETEVGSGLAVPNWARCILQASILMQYLALTTVESVTGYFKVTNDENTLEPCEWPLPVHGAALATAVGSHLAQPVTVPIMWPVTPKDTVHVKFALDATTTGVHVVDAYLLFSSGLIGPRSRIHAKKCAATATGDALTDGTEVDIETIAGKTRDMLGLWAYLSSTGTITAAEGIAGHLTMKSNAAGWQEQQLPLTQEGAGLGTDIASLGFPIIYTQPELFPYFDGFIKRLWPQPFPIGDRQTFTFAPFNDRDIGNDIDPKFRVGLMWTE